MSVVSSSKVTGFSYTSPPLLAGDLVVLAVSRDWEYGGLPTPAGWQRATGDVITLISPGGGASGVAWTVSAVFWRRAASAGSLSASFGSGLAAILSVVLRGPTALADVDRREMNAQVFTYPAVSLGQPMTGHVIHVGITPAEYVESLHPVGDTALQAQRVSASGVVNGAGQPVVRTSLLSMSERPITSVSTVPAASTSQRVSGTSVTLVFADVAGPDAPALLSPAAGSVDLAAGFTVAWTPSGAQTGYALRRRQGSGAWEYWDGAGWAGSQKLIDGTDTTVTVPPGQFVNTGTAWTLAVATRGDALRPELGQYASVTVVGKAAPAAPTLTVSDVSGGALTSFTPTLTMTGTAGSGASLTGYRVQLVQAGRVVHEVTVSSPYTLPVAVGLLLTNGTPLTFRVAVVQDGSQVGPYVERTYDLAVPTPAPPLVVAERFEHPDSGLPGVRVTVSTPVTGTLTLYRDGTVVDVGPVAGGFDAIIYDYEAPTNVPVEYAATVTTDDPIPVTSPRGAAAPIVLDRADGWLIDPARPGTAVKIYLQEVGERQHGTRSHRYNPLDSSRWIVHSGLRVDAAASMTVATLTPDGLTAALALLTSGRLLLLRMLPEMDGAIPGEFPTPGLRFRVSGDVSEARIVQRAVAWRALSFEYAEVVD